MGRTNEREEKHYPINLCEFVMNNSSNNVQISTINNLFERKMECLLPSLQYLNESFGLKVIPTFLLNLQDYRGLVLPSPLQLRDRYLMEEVLEMGAEVTTMRYTVLIEVLNSESFDW